MKFERVDDTVWPVDEDEEVQWWLRYGRMGRTDDSPEQRKLNCAASVLAAYSHLIDPSRPEREAIAALKRARQAARRAHMEQTP